MGPNSNFNPFTTTMKRHIVLSALTGLVACLSSCAYPPRINWVSTGQVIPSSPSVHGPLYAINGVALQQYSPKLYTPFKYDHRSMADNTFYQAQAARHPFNRGSVFVGPLTLQASADPYPGYEVRRAESAE